MKILVIKGRLSGQFHLKLPKRYQMRTSSPIPFPSTLLGAFTRAYLETLQEHFPDKYVDEINNAMKNGFMGIGEVLIGVRGGRRGIELSMISPSLILRDRVLAAYFTYLEYRTIPSASILMHHIKYQIFDEPPTSDSEVINVMGREYYFSANKIALVYVVEDSIPDEILTLSGFKIRSLGSRESFVDVEDVKIVKLDELEDIGAEGEISVSIPENICDVLAGEYVRLVLTEITKSKKKKEEEIPAVYPKWFADMSSLIIPGKLGRGFLPGKIIVRMHTGWRLVRAEGITFPIKY